MAGAMKTAVYFDLETGGLEAHHPDIQLAAIAIEEGTWREIETFEAKIRFDEARADPEALKLNHYDPHVWAETAQPAANVVDRFSGFLKKYSSLSMVSKRTGNPYTVAKLVAHNANFDGPRLQRLFKAHDKFLPADPRVRCTVQRAMWWVDEHGPTPPENYQLATLCKYFGIKVAESHDALADVRLTVQLARALALSEPRPEGPRA